MIIEEKKLSDPVVAANLAVNEDTCLTTAAGEAMEKNEDELIKFVNVQIAKMDEKLLFDGSNTPPLEAIDRELMKHPHILLALTSLETQARWALKEAKASYDEWYSDVFLKVRNLVNDPKSPASKWYTKEEIGMMVTSKYKAQKAELLAAVELADAKLSLLRRLIDGWNSYQFELTQLSKNGIAEMHSISNTPYDGVSS